MGTFLGSGYNFGGFVAAPAAGSYEDLTTFTLVDPESNAVVNSSSITITDLDCHWTDFYMYKDYGVDYFGASFEIQYELTVSKFPSVVARFAGVLKTDNAYGAGDTTVGPQTYIGYEGATYEIHSGDDSYAMVHYALCVKDTKYYCTMKRTTGDPGSVSVDVYSDAARSVLVQNIDRPDIPVAYFDTHRYFMVGWANRVRSNEVIDDDCASDDTSDWKVADCAASFVSDHYVITETASSQSFYQDSLTFVDGQVYQAKFDIKDGGVASETINLVAGDTFYGGEVLDENVVTTTSWVTHTFTFTAGAATAALSFQTAMGHGAAESYEIKNISFHALNYASYVIENVSIESH